MWEGTEAPQSGSCSARDSKPTPVPERSMEQVCASGKILRTQQSALYVGEQLPRAGFCQVLIPGNRWSSRVSLFRLTSPEKKKKKSPQKPQA